MTLMLLPSYHRIRGLAVYLASQCLSQAVNLVRALILPNLLGPSGYGLLATINALDRYTPYVSVGAHYYVLHRVPALDDRERTLETICGFTLLTSGIAGLAAIVAAAFQLGPRPVEVAYGIAALALNPLSSGVWRLHSSMLRVDAHIGLMTKLTNAQTLASSALIVGLTLWWGIVGTFTAQLLTAVFVLVLVRAASPYRFRPRVDWSALRTVLGFSIPVFVVGGLLVTTIDTAEIFVLAHRLGASAVGMYSWGVAMAALLFMWTNAVTTVFSTSVVRGVHEDGETGTHEGVRFFARLLLANSLVLVALVSVAYVFLPIVARVVFPSFEAAVVAARLLVLSTYYESLSVLGLFVLTAQRRFNDYLVWLTVLVAVLLPVLWWLAPRGIVVLAALTIVRRLVKAHVVLHLALRRAFPRWFVFAGFCAAIYGLGLVPIAAGWLVDLGDVPVTPQNFLDFAPQVLGAFVGVTVGLAAVLYTIQRRFGLLGVLWRG